MMQKPSDFRSGGGRPALRLVAMGALIVTGAMALGGCSSTSKSSNKYGVTSSPRVIQPGQPVPSGGGYFKVGSPYKVAGRWYRPKEDPGYDQVGLASWYGDDFHGRRTANGEIFDMASLSAAHPTLPLPTYARVTNLENGRSVVVRINDRGPFAHDRVIDLSKRTADVLDFQHRGTVKVRVQYVGMAPLEGKDGQWLTTTVRHDGQPVGPVMMASLDTTPTTGSVPQQAGSPTQTNALRNPPPPPPQEAASIYLKTQNAYQSAPDVTPQPITAAYTVPAVQPPARGPVPQVPVPGGGTGKVTYKWVSGYAMTGGKPTVADVFAMFDAHNEVVVIVASTALPSNRSLTYH